MEIAGQDDCPQTVCTIPYPGRDLFIDDDIDTVSVRTQEELSQARRSRLLVRSIYRGNLAYDSVLIIIQFFSKP